MHYKNLSRVTVIVVLMLITSIPVNGADFNFSGKWKQVENPDWVMTIKETADGIYGLSNTNNVTNEKTHGIGFFYRPQNILLYSFEYGGTGERGCGFGTLKPIKNDQFRQETYNPDGTKRHKRHFVRIR